MGAYPPRMCCLSCACYSNIILLMCACIINYLIIVIMLCVLSDIEFTGASPYQTAVGGTRVDIPPFVP